MRVLDDYRCDYGRGELSCLTPRNGSKGMYVCSMYVCPEMEFALLVGALM